MGILQLTRFVVTIGNVIFNIKGDRLCCTSSEGTALVYRSCENIIFAPGNSIKPLFWMQPLRATIWINVSLSERPQAGPCREFPVA